MSEVIGAILVFGLVVALMAVLQTQAIPSANEEVEFQHSQDSQRDLTRLHESMIRSGVRGEAESVTVDLGTSYPSRMLFYNPAPVQGSLRTSDVQTVKIENIEATDGQTADYLSGTLNYDTRTIEYAANYNEYQNGPGVTIENTVLYHQFEDDNVRVANAGQLVDGKKISLVTVAGNVEKSSAGTASVTVKSVSSQSRTVLVSDSAAGKLRLTLETSLSQQVWIEEILADELDDPGGSNGDGPEPDDTCQDVLNAGMEPNNERYLEGCEFGGDTITLIFESGRTYELRMGQVQLDGSAPGQTATYATPVAGNNSGIPEGGQEQLTIEVRDEFNNPVTGETVDFHVSGGSGNGVLRTLGGTTGTTVTATTDENGQATVVYQAPTGIGTTTDVTINASIDGSVGPSFDPSTPEGVNYEVSVAMTGGAAPGTDPAIVQFDVTDNSVVGTHARYNVDWRVVDTDTSVNENLGSVDLELVRVDTGQVVDTASYSYTNRNDVSDSVVLEELNIGSPTDYVIRIKAEDAAGRTDEQAEVG